jgi:hypothetical protein
MNTTTRQLAQTLCRPSCIVLVGLLMLVGEAHLSPVVAGQLDALVASTPSLEDGGSLVDLQYPDKILTLVRESFGNTEPVFAFPDLPTGGPVSGELEHGLTYALGPSPEEFPDEFADRAGNPTLMEGIWALGFDTRDDLERVRVAADAIGPGLYNDHDWFDSAALVLIGSGAGAALVFLGFSRFRVRRRHTFGPGQSHRPHYRFHRSRRRAFRGR